MKQIDKNALADWQEFHKSYASDMPVENGLTRHDIDKMRRRLEADPIEWIKYFFPRYAKYDFAPFHIRAIRRLIKHDEWYEVLSWSRELAKSTVCMFILMYLTLTGRKKFVVLASATEESAEKLITPYRLNFERNARLKQFYGRQEVIGAWGKTDFSCKCGARFVAIGAGSAPRGARNEDIRPDVIYLDDFDTDKDCRNPDVLQKKWEWFEQALYPTRSISEPTLILWCGNIIARDCCIVRAGAHAKSWDIVNIRDKEGRSTWPAKNTEEHIDNTLAHISQRAAQNEYFNNPIVEGTVFKNLPFGKVPALSKFKFLIAYGDPSPSDNRKKNSSFKSLVLVGKLKGVYYIIKAFVAHETNANFIDWYFQMDQWVGGKTTVYNYIENNKLQDPFYQQVFRPLLLEQCKARQSSLFIRPDERRKTDKATRIEANLEPLDRNGTWIFNEAERDNPHMQELISQFQLFELTMPYPADGPDAVEGGISMVDIKTAEVEPIITYNYNDINSNNPYQL